MSKAEETRQRIIREAAVLFNQQGYAGASMGDIMRATGLQKGGIYNHFESKDAIALAAFDYATATIAAAYMAAIRQHRHAIDRLLAMLALYRDFIDHPPLVGGCPILNTAIESDDAHPALRQRAQQSMDNWRSLLRKVLQRGIERGEVVATVNTDTVATVIIATVEGAVMMSKLYDDGVHLQRAVAHLEAYLRGLTPKP